MVPALTRAIRLLPLLSVTSSEHALIRRLKRTHELFVLRLLLTAPNPVPSCCLRQLPSRHARTSAQLFRKLLPMLHRSVHLTPKDVLIQPKTVTSCSFSAAASRQSHASALAFGQVSADRLYHIQVVVPHRFRLMLNRKWKIPLQITRKIRITFRVTNAADQ